MTVQNKTKKLKRKEKKVLPVIKSLLKLFTTVPVILFFVATFVTQTHAATGINRQINFQGKLTNSAGVNVSDSSYSVVFSLYSVSSGGTAIWTETQSVTTVAGIFQVSLGSQTSLAGVNFNSDTLYLGIKVGSDDEMTPRIRYTATPYAFNAEKLNGVTATQSATGFTLTGGSSTPKTLTLNDDITIGLTISPTSANALTVQSNGANNLSLDTGGNGSVLIGNGSATGITLGRSGQGITLSGFATNNNSVLYTGASGALAAATTTNSGECLLSNANTPAWGTCPGGGSSNWNVANGVVAPKMAATLDLLLGGTSTSSAKFRFINVNSGTPTASIAAQTGNGSIFIDGSGNLGTTNAQTLTIGSSGTGNINLSFANTGTLLINGSAGNSGECLKSSGLGSVITWGTCGSGSAGYLEQRNGLTYVGNTTTDFAVGGISTSSAAFRVSVGGTTSTASIAANTSFAGLVIDNRGTGDLLTASSAGMTRLTLKQNGALVLGTAANGLTFDPLNGGPTYTGSARIARTITLSAEYHHAILTASGSAAITGDMTSDASPSATFDSGTHNWMNYFMWTSTQTSLNDYTIAVRVTLPQDFSAWNTNAIQIYYNTQLTTADTNKMDVVIYNDEDTTATPVYYSQANKSGTAKTWTTLTITNAMLTAGSQTWNAADSTAVIYLKLYAKGGNYVQVGDIVLNYLSKF